MILSASRRTDIPAYYPEWFINRIREGYVLVRNPMNYHMISKINLAPEVVDCIVFWSKNPKPLEKYLPELDGKYMYYFQYTVNGYGKDVEPNIPSVDERIDTFKRISEKVGKGRVIWRYDPIIITDKYTPDWHTGMFKYIAKKLGNYTDECVFSFVDLYDKIKTNMRLLHYTGMTNAIMKELAQHFSTAAAENCIALKTCSEELELSEYNIGHSCCIDPALISRLTNANIKAKKDKNQRESCGCAESIDIGQYNTCKNGCVYCYANYSKDSVNSNCHKHDDSSPLLIGHVQNDDSISERKIATLKDNQLSFF